MNDYEKMMHQMNTESKVWTILKAMVFLGALSALVYFLAQ